MNDQTADREGLTEVLGAHEYALEMRRGSICLCGFVPTVEPETLQTQQDYHRAHLADAILASPQFARIIAAAEARGAERVRSAVEAKVAAYSMIHGDKPGAPMSRERIYFGVTLDLRAALATPDTEGLT